MITTQIQNKIQGLRGKSADGFTMVEVVLAGVMLVSVMTAVAQMSVSALAGSRNLSMRTRMEAAVNNDIQLLQQADFYLTIDSINANDQTNACLDPTNHLISYLNVEIPDTDLAKLGIDRTMQVGATPDVVEVVYSFVGPEQGVDDEYRVVELNPNFSAQCYTTN